MFRSLSRKRRFGFTLVEVLVTTVVVGVMAAVVIPAMVKQTTAADSPRVASDLGSVKSAIEVFAQNVRPQMPGDIEDLVNAISTTDEGIDGEFYTTTHTPKWKGPYLEWAADITLGQPNTVFNSGGGATVINGLFRCPSPTSGYNTVGNDLPCVASTDNTTEIAATDRYISVKIAGMGLAGSGEFLRLNDIIDGVSEGGSTTDKQNFGILRQNASGTVFFLAVPYTRP